MIETHELSEEQARCLLSPLRAAILRFIAARESTGASEIHGPMGAHEKSVFYHLRHLERVGLIRPVGQRPGTTKPETLYEAIARDFFWKGKGSPERRAIAQKKLRSTLRKIERDASAAEPDQIVLMRSNDLRLSEAELVELRRRMNELTDWALSKSGSSGESVSLTTLIVPLKS